MRGFPSQECTRVLRLPRSIMFPRQQGKKIKHDIRMGFVKWPSCVPHECLRGRLIRRMFAFGSRVWLRLSLQKQFVTCSPLMSNVRWYLVRLGLGQLTHTVKRIRVFRNAGSRQKLKFTSLSLCVDLTLTALQAANTAEMWMVIITVWNVQCSLLLFCLLSLFQTTSQWIRIYCCFCVLGEDGCLRDSKVSSVSSSPCSS